MLVIGKIETEIHINKNRIFTSYARFKSGNYLPFENDNDLINIIKQDDFKILAQEYEKYILNTEFNKIDKNIFLKKSKNIEIYLQESYDSFKLLGMFFNLLSNRVEISIGDRLIQENFLRSYQDFLTFSTNMEFIKNYLEDKPLPNFTSRDKAFLDVQKDLAYKAIANIKESLDVE